MFKQSKQIYLDYASGTPCDAEVFKKMKPYFVDTFANPSALHKGATKIKKDIEDARSKCALQLGVKPHEVFFQSGGTESINTAILGVGRYFLSNSDFKEKPHIITSTIEHPAVLEPVLQLEKEGCEVTFVSPDKRGLISEDKIQKALTVNTVLVSIGLVNGELGTIQPIRKIVKKVHAFKKEQKREETSYPYVHTDAAQAPLVMSIKQEKFLVDMLSVDSSKIYGPRFGLLCKKQYVPTQQILFGGGQEKKLRPGTENTPYIIGITEALVKAQENKDVFVSQTRELKAYFVSRLQEELSDVSINGSLEEKLSSPLIVNVCFAKYTIDAEFFVLQLDAKNIAVSAMTACKTLDDTAYSYVISNVTDAHKENPSDKECAGASVRFSFGKTTTKKELEQTVTTIKKIIEDSASRIH